MLFSRHVCVQARTLGARVRGIRTNRPLSGRFAQGCMRLYGAWPCTLHGRSKRSGCGRFQVGPITFSQTHHRANFIDNVVLKFSAIVNTQWPFLTRTKPVLPAA